MARACFQRVKPAQAGWLNVAVMKSGDKCIKRGCLSADAEVRSDGLQRLRKLATSQD